MSTLDIHHKFAVKVGTSWVSVDEKGKYYLSAKEATAETRWDIRGALGIGERYIKANWNVTMGDKPDMVVERVHRPQRIYHAW